jgi:putative salt-induced outer membrane protein
VDLDFKRTTSSAKKETVVKATMLTLAAVLMLSPSLLADQISLKNGDRLSGTIETSDAKTLMIKTQYEGEVTVQWAAVETIHSEEPLHVGLSGGQVLVGPVSTSDGELRIATRDAGTVVTKLDSVSLIRSSAEEAAYEAKMQRLLHPRLTDLWGGFLDTGISFTRGNSQTLNFVLSGKAVRTSTRDKITVYANSVFANNGTTGVSITTANAINGGIRVDMDVNSKLFMFGFTDFTYDEFQQLDLRNVLGSGLGYHVIKTDATTFDVYGGGGFDQAYYSTPLTIRSGVANAGESLTHSVSKRTSFSERFDFYPNLSETGQYRFLFNTTATTALNSWLGWQVTFNDGYVSNPPPLIKKNDLLFSTGLRLTFGNGAK